MLASNFQFPNSSNWVQALLPHLLGSTKKIINKKTVFAITTLS